MLNIGKAPGNNESVAEMVQQDDWVILGLPFFIVWMRDKTLQERRGFIFVSLYKTGPKVICDNYCQISLLSDVGKIFAKLLLTQLLDHVALNILPELQCSFWPNRSTTDMIFMASQVQEKSNLISSDLYMATYMLNY